MGNFQVRLFPREFLQKKPGRPDTKVHFGNAGSEKADNADNLKSLADQFTATRRKTHHVAGEVLDTAQTIFETLQAIREQQLKSLQQTQEPQALLSQVKNRAEALQRLQKHTRSFIDDQMRIYHTHVSGLIEHYQRIAEQLHEMQGKLLEQIEAEQAKIRQGLNAYDSDLQTLHTHFPPSDYSDYNEG